MSRDRVLEFLVHTTSRQPLTFVTEHGVRIGVIAAGQGLQLVILVDDETRIDHVRDAWAEVLKWRDALREYQGSSTTRERFYHDLESLQMSYRQKAQRINERLAELLEQCVKYAEQEQGETERIYNSIKVRVSFAEADNLLSFCRPRLSEQERIDLLGGACQRIRAGDKAFDPDSPVVARDIQDRLRYWRGEKTG